MIGGLASLPCSVAAPESVYLVLVSIAGFAVVGVWMSISASHFFHRRAFVRNGGHFAALAYRAPFYPVLPMLAWGCAWCPSSDWRLTPTKWRPCISASRSLFSATSTPICGTAPPTPSARLRQMF